MSIFSRADELLPGLLPAAWRGVVFHAPNASHEAGRRVLKTYFPGIDQPAFDDFGRHDGPIEISGLIVGDDYIARAEALRAALQAPGPGTLFHPWLGEITALPTRPAVISFDVRSLRVAHFRASFERVGVSRGAPVSTLAGVLAASAALVVSAASIVAGLLGGISSIAVWSAARETAGQAADAFERRLGRSGAASLAQEAEPALAAISDFDRTPSQLPRGGREDARALGEAVIALPAIVAKSVRPRPRPAIGAGRSSPVSVPVLRPERGAGLLVAHAADVAALETFSPAEASVKLAAQAAAVAAAIEAATEIRFESRQQAIAWRARLDNALAALAEATAEVAPEAPDPAARVWGDIAHCRAQLARDMHEILGRLPAVRIFTPAGTVSAWLLAQHFGGDDPASVAPLFDDIVRRNRLRHPGAVPPEPIEVLVR